MEEQDGLVALLGNQYRERDCRKFEQSSLGFINNRDRISTGSWWHTESTVHQVDTGAADATCQLNLVSVDGSFRCTSPRF